MFEEAILFKKPFETKFIRSFCWRFFGQDWIGRDRHGCCFLFLSALRRTSQTIHLDKMLLDDASTSNFVFLRPKTFRLLRNSPRDLIGWDVFFLELLMKSLFGLFHSRRLNEVPKDKRCVPIKWADYHFNLSSCFFLLFVSILHICLFELKSRITRFFVPLYWNSINMDFSFQMVPTEQSKLVSFFYTPTPIQTWTVLCSRSPFPDEIFE